MVGSETFSCFLKQTIFFDISFI